MDYKNVKQDDNTLNFLTGIPSALVFYKIRCPKYFKVIYHEQLSLPNFDET